MAISFNGADVTDVTRNTNFTRNISIITSAGEVITSIEIGPSPSTASLDTGISVSATTSSVTISGSYESTFDQDTIKSFPAGKSIFVVPAVRDANGNVTTPERELTAEEFEIKKQQFPNIVEPTVSTSFAAVPSGHTVYEANQDGRTSIDVLYALKYYYTINGVAQTPISQIMTHTVNTSTTAFSAKLKELYPDEP